MQSSGVPDCIQVSPSTYELLQGKFQLTPRGAIVCKGVGEVTTYLLGAKNQAMARVLAR